MDSTEALKIVDSLAEKTRSMIRSYCQWECHRPFTQNNEYNDSQQHKLLAHLVQQLKEILSPPEPLQETATPGRFAGPSESPVEPRQALTGDIATFCRVAGSIRLQPSEETTLQNIGCYESELVVISATAAYFYVSFKRVIDIIPMCIENEFLIAFTRELREKLLENLGLTEDDGVERCKKFAVPEPYLRERKEALMKMKETLDKASEIMKEI